MSRTKNRQAQTEPMSSTPGFPGYRTRPGRTDYDPLDTNREAARTEGLFYRKLFTFQLRTRNAFYLSLMVIFGLPIFIFAMLFFIDTLQNITSQSWQNTTLMLLALLIPFALSIFLLANFTLSVMDIVRHKNPNTQPRKESPGGHKKKIPRHRKDYR